MTEEIDPDMWAMPDLRPALIGHDIGALYRAVNESGVSQRQIAALTGTTQPQVHDILTGRRARVMAYEVLVRNAKGLGIPLERMGLSFWGPDGKYYGPEDAYPGNGKAAQSGFAEEVDDEMLRRHLIAWGGIIMAGAPVEGVGELLAELSTTSLPVLPPVPLPARLFEVHVTKVRDLTQRLGQAGRTFGSDPETSTAAAISATRLLKVPGAEPVKQALMIAVAELHIHAGWAAYDACFYRCAMQHYANALELATKAGDAYCQALALNCAGLATVEHGHPNDGLKMLQAAQVAAWGIPTDSQRAVVGEGSRAALQACGRADSATALARLGHLDTADRELATSREMWTPTRTDPGGDLDYVAAWIQVSRGQLDLAEQFATASVRRWESGNSQRDRTGSTILLATIHVKAGEQRGLQLAHNAITDVTKLTSVRTRRRLVPLIVALEARPGSDAKELARMARQVAA